MLQVRAESGPLRPKIEVVVICSDDDPGLELRAGMVARREEFPASVYLIGRGDPHDVLVDVGAGNVPQVAEFVVAIGIGGAL